MSADSYPPETLELIYNEVKDRLNTQFQSLDGLNTKASIIIGFVGVIIGISLQLYFTPVKIALFISRPAV
jgi:hypothetical protein